MTPPDPAPHLAALNQPIIFVDTETGGRDPLRHPLLTIGLVTLTPQGEVARPLHLRVRHERYDVEPEAMAVNGIDLEAHHAAAQPPGEVAQAVRLYAGGGSCWGGTTCTSTRAFCERSCRTWGVCFGGGGWTRSSAPSF